MKTKKTKVFKGFMVILMAVCFMLCSAGSPAQSAEVTIEWDANTEANLAGYNIYQAERSGYLSSAWEKIGTNEPDTEGLFSTEYTLTVDGSKNWAWHVTAFNSDGIESGPSNTVELYDRNPPGNPKNARKK